MFGQDGRNFFTRSLCNNLQRFLAAHSRELHNHVIPMTQAPSPSAPSPHHGHAAASFHHGHAAAPLHQEQAATSTHRTRATATPHHRQATTPPHHRQAASPPDTRHPTPTMDHGNLQSVVIDIETDDQLNFAVPLFNYFSVLGN